MRAVLLSLSLTVLAYASPARAQAPSPCDRLAGAEQKRCLKQEEQHEERRRQERERLGREEDGKPRSCDRLFGPEKKLCLERGGTVRASKVR